MTDDLYIELLCCFAPPVHEDGQIRPYVVRAMTVQSLAELAADLATADAEGHSVEDVLIAWSCVYD